MKQKSSHVSCHWDSADNKVVFGRYLPYATFLHDVICRQENFFYVPAETLSLYRFHRVTFIVSEYTNPVKSV